MTPYSVDHPHHDDIGHPAAISPKRPHPFAYRVYRENAWKVRHRDGLLVPSRMTSQQIEHLIGTGALWELTL